MGKGAYTFPGLLSKLTLILIGEGFLFYRVISGGGGQIRKDWPKRLKHDDKCDMMDNVLKTKYHLIIG